LLLLTTLLLLNFTKNHNTLSLVLLGINIAREEGEEGGENGDRSFYSFLG
jgi:hypothetical protein